MLPSIAERVTAGAAFLDEHDPGWWRADGERAIDLDTLDISDQERCILGQRCPLTVLAAYAGVDPNDEDEMSAVAWEAYRAYAASLAGVHGIRLLDWAERRGFAYESQDRAQYQALTGEWKRVILARRAAEAVPA